jgi:hypothetical protein
VCEVGKDNYHSISFTELISPAHEILEFSGNAVLEPLLKVAGGKAHLNAIGSHFFIFHPLSCHAFILFPSCFIKTVN